MPLQGRHGGSMVARQTVVLLSRVRIWCLPSQQLTANLLAGWHLGYHLALGLPLWVATEQKITKNEPLVRQKHLQKKKRMFCFICLYFKINISDAFYIKNVPFSIPSPLLICPLHSLLSAQLHFVCFASLFSFPVFYSHDSFSFFVSLFSQPYPLYIFSYLSRLP